MMVKLSEIPYDELSIGDKVISAIGTHGEIIKIVFYVKQSYRFVLWKTNCPKFG